MNGLYRTAEEINQIKGKTLLLQKQNEELSGKLNSAKRTSSTPNNHLHNKKSAD
jgi:hypothetical protein